MAFKDYIAFRMNGVDPDPKVHAFLGNLISEVFRFAEYILIAGAFLFIAKQSGSIALIGLSIVLQLLLFIYLFSTLAGFMFFNWRKAESKLVKFLFFTLDTSIFLAIYFVGYKAMTATTEALVKGIGV